MRELHVIGLSADGQHLLLAATPDAAKPSHRVPVDNRFEATLRGQKPEEPQSGPALSVADMQARLRAGATVEEVAALAGYPVTRVERFAGPVISEREEVVRKVVAAVQHSRRGVSVLPLGQAVAIAVAAVPNVKMDTFGWTAHRLANGGWVATASVFARGRVRKAQWALDTEAKTVRPLDSWAGQLGHVDTLPSPARAARPATPPATTAGLPPSRRVGRPASSAPASATKAAAKKAPAKKAAKAAKTARATAAPATKAAKTARATPSAATPATAAKAARRPAPAKAAAKTARATPAPSKATRATPAPAKATKAAKAAPAKRAAKQARATPAGPPAAKVAKSAKAAKVARTSPATSRAAAAPAKKAAKVARTEPAAPAQAPATKAARSTPARAPKVARSAPKVARSVPSAPSDAVAATRGARDQ